MLSWVLQRTDRAGLASQTPPAVTGSSWMNVRAFVCASIRTRYGPEDNQPGARGSSLNESPRVSSSLRVIPSRTLPTDLPAETRTVHVPPEGRTPLRSEKTDCLAIATGAAGR